MAQVSYKVPAKLTKDPLALFRYANELNSQFIFMKAYVREFRDETTVIIFSSVVEGNYDRKNFSIFSDNVERDLNQFHPRA